MTYLQPHKRPYQRLARVIAGSVGAVALISIIILIFSPHIFSAVFTSIARPFWRLEFSIESGSLKSPERLLAENEQLKNELAEFRASSQTIDFVKAENQELKALLGREDALAGGIESTSTPKSSKPVREAGILAAVLKRPPLSPYDEVIIDIGSDYHVSTSSMAYAAGNVLIGRVVSVLSNASKVKLFSSPGERYEVLVGSARTPATAMGRGGGQYEAQVSRESGIREGDPVASSSLNDGPFGMVTSVLSDPTQPFETILFAPAVNVYQLRWVTIR